MQRECSKTGSYVIVTIVQLFKVTLIIKLYANDGEFYSM